LSLYAFIFDMKIETGSSLWKLFALCCVLVTI